MKSIKKEEMLLESVCKVCPLIMSYVQSVLVIRECVVGGVVGVYKKN
jgi:hypothetical protein